MIVDASALCAILFREPERERFIDVIGRASTLFISPIQFWEVSVAVEQRRDGGFAATEQLVVQSRIGVASIGGREATLAFDAWSRFGKGRHPAGLNLGDCFAYALAKSRDMPLLYKGDDFARTDITSIL